MANFEIVELDGIRTGIPAAEDNAVLASWTRGVRTKANRAMFPLSRKIVVAGAANLLAVVLVNAISRRHRSDIRSLGSLPRWLFLFSQVHGQPRVPYQHETDASP